MKTGVIKSGEPGASTPPPSRRQNTQGLIYVCLAVIMFGTSPVLIRWSAPFGSTEIAFWRLAIAALLVLCLGLITRTPLLLKRQQLPRFCFYGLVTAMHFFFYIASLSFTTIAHSLSIIYTSPIFVTIFSALYLHERLTIRKYLGIAVAVIGIAIIAGFEPHYTACSLQGQCMILGDGLALLSAVCFGVYSVAGRGERDRHPLFRYTANVYGLAALWLLPLAIVPALQHAYPPLAIASVVALGIFPLGLGHTLYNAAIRRTYAIYANLIATQEVTVGVLLGVVTIHEIPSPTTIVGIVVAMVGIVGVLV